MSTATAPHFVAEARSRKAASLADHLRLLGIDASEAAMLTEQDKRDVERGAGVTRPGSRHTWRVVMDMLAGSASPEALCRTCGMGDPEGVDGPRKPYGHPGPCSR